MLRDAPFDTVKIDRSFLAKQREGGADAAVVLRSIVALAHELGRAVVAEGVESEADISHLGEIGCDLAQGFHFAEPLAHAEVPGFLATNPGSPGGLTEAVSGVAGVRGEA
jgi:EAL domain-containing protein (putative c-di-GMP-specific phosphodiesterase class I)